MWTFSACDLFPSFPKYHSRQSWHNQFCYRTWPVTSYRVELLSFFSTWNTAIHIMKMTTPIFIFLLLWLCHYFTSWQSSHPFVDSEFHQVENRNKMNWNSSIGCFDTSLNVAQVVSDLNVSFKLGSFDPKHITSIRIRIQSYIHTYFFNAVSLISGIFDSYIYKPLGLRTLSPAPWLLYCLLGRLLVHTKLVDVSLFSLWLLPVMCLYAAQRRIPRF